MTTPVTPSHLMKPEHGPVAENGLSARGSVATVHLLREKHQIGAASAGVCWIEIDHRRRVHCGLGHLAVVVQYECRDASVSFENDRHLERGLDACGGNRRHSAER